MNVVTSKYDVVKSMLLNEPKKWVVTGVAGFIGSNLLETLLKLNQKVVGLDNFSTGYAKNLEDVKSSLDPEQWSNFQFIEGDIKNLDTCQRVCEGADFVLHQAALGSVPRSINNPINTNDNNVTGFLNMLVAGRDANVKSFVYASSSSTYGDHEALPKVEEIIGMPLSPYAVSKYVNELYAQVFARCYGFSSIGLRYFNVFGKRQDPNGAYAAVIPKWTAAIINGEPAHINGDGKTSRDFCYIANAVQANILAAVTQNPEALNQIYNVAVGDRTDLNQLFDLLVKTLEKQGVVIKSNKPIYQDFREGDVRHSQADISKAQRLLGYKPTHSVEAGILDAIPWYLYSLSPHQASNVRNA